MGNSRFVTEEMVNGILEKISDGGIESLTDLNRNQLKLYNEGDAVIESKIDEAVVLIIELRDEVMKQVRNGGVGSKSPSQQLLNMSKLGKIKYDLYKDYGVDPHHPTIEQMIESKITIHDNQ